MNLSLFCWCCNSKALFSDVVSTGSVRLHLSLNLSTLLQQGFPPRKSQYLVGTLQKPPQNLDLLCCCYFSSIWQISIYLVQKVIKLSATYPESLTDSQSESTTLNPQHMLFLFDMKFQNSTACSYTWTPTIVPPLF